MVKNAKFHATAISIIILVIIVLYLLIGPKQASQSADAPLQPTDHYVRIASASWGLNCGPYVADAIRARASMPLTKDASGNVVTQPPITQPTPNNVLDAVKAMCDGKRACQIPVNSGALGLEPLQVCYKKFEVGYRCYEMDRLTTKEVDQGQTVTLDCRPQAADQQAAPGNNPAPQSNALPQATH